MVALVEKCSSCEMAWQAWAKKDSFFAPGNPNTDVHTGFEE
jgi:hypothetical protein